MYKRKKKSRLRGTHTHGWGAKKKHRGAGHRGGRGNAGTGKRGDSTKPSIWKNTKYFGKYGFKKLSPSPVINTINLQDIEFHTPKWEAAKLIEKKGDTYIVDLKKLGFNKVLGSGAITQKYKITASYFSAKASEKIQAAGGEAIFLEVPIKESKEKEEIAKETPAEKSKEGS